MPDLPPSSATETAANAAAFASGVHDGKAAFSGFLDETVQQSGPRRAISDARLVDEAARVAALLAEAPSPSPSAETLARFLVGKLRARRPGAAETLLQAFPLGTPAGLALMNLAEALPRTTDRTARQALVDEALADVDWSAAGGDGRGLSLARLSAAALKAGRAASGTVPGAAAALRLGFDTVIGQLARHFIAGRTIEAALGHAGRREALGYRYSFDMLGEAAVCEADAARYLALYESAIAAVGTAAADGLVTRFADRPVEGPGVSIKLSALHPRFSRAQRATVMEVLLHRLTGLVRLAARYGIGLTIDAEEIDRLDLTHDLFEALCADPETRDWKGLGIVVQAYHRAAPEVIDQVVDLAHRSGRRLTVRLVKGAYWDTEIKRAQLAGLSSLPVFTRKEHTDLSYLVCAQRMLDADGAIYPQFATHNAQTVAAIWRMAGGPDAPRERYEFQCLHGMGEALYDEVVPPDRLYRPCRIYAPVGSHDALLAYLARRLLENGANSAFVNRVADQRISAAELSRAPQTRISEAPKPGAPSALITAPPALFGARRSAAGLDFAHEPTLRRLAEALAETTQAAPGTPAAGGRVITDPANPDRIIGTVADTLPEAVGAAFDRAPETGWAEPADARAAVLHRAADHFELELTGGTAPTLLSLIVREAGRTIADAVGELREAIDFLRYYADAAPRDAGKGSRPVGRVVCISPWNFPVAIFIGQIAAALAAGNAVLAKPAVQTPLAGVAATALLHGAGIPHDVLQVLPGDVATGEALVADSRCDAVMFTGSTRVARSIAITLAGRTTRGGPIPLIAETGGQNAIIVDPTALAEQAVLDIVTSAFNSAGQRCSAARVLCLPEATAEPILAMLRGAMTSLKLGPPDRLSNDIGPLISAQAAARVTDHIERLRRWGRPVFSTPHLPQGGHFVAPTLVEVGSVNEIGEEVFGPVLHVVRYRSGQARDLVRQIADLGYGLTFGIHSRLRGATAELARIADAGNTYINRNTIGAVVGAQPFGGHGLSGTGPKAGGPLTLRRLLAKCAAPPNLPQPTEMPGALVIWQSWLHGNKHVALATSLAPTAVGTTQVLPAPVGERNLYRLVSRGFGLCLAGNRESLYRQIGAVLASGAKALISVEDAERIGGLDSLSVYLDQEIQRLPRSEAFRIADFALTDRFAAPETLRALAEGAPHIVAVFSPDDDQRYPTELLLGERSESSNTAAVGGDASLLSVA